MKSAFKSNLWNSWTAVLGLTVLLFAAHLSGVIDFHESDAMDLHFRLRGSHKADSRIVIVAIDDASLASAGQWPWPRGIYAGFLNIISQYHPQAVFLDILFPEKSPVPEEDEKLAAAAAKAGNVVLPFFYYSEKPFKASFPIDILENSAKALAYANAPKEKDGKVRRLPAFLKNGEETFYPPAVAMKNLADKTNFDIVPHDSQNRVWINFPGGMDAFEVISFRDVITAAATQQTEKLQKLFSGRMVFVGHAATGTTDLIATPFSSQAPGVLIPASLMHTILTGKYLYKIPAVFDFLILFVLTGFSGWLFSKNNPGRGFLILLGILAGFFSVNILLFLAAGWISLLYVPMSAAILIYVLTLFMKYTEIHFQREIIDREMATAARIQEQFLPQGTPLSTHLDSAFECRFTKQVGGDLYDWTDLGGGNFGFAAGDVSGKGMPAAIYMAKAISDFRNIQKQHQKPGKVCSLFNETLLSNPTEAMFLTFFYGTVDASCRKLAYASAGHEPGFLFRARSKKAEILTAGQGMPLAMFETEYETVEVEISPGDCLLLYTDGIKELRNPKKQELGTERLKQIFEEIAASEENSKDIVRKLFERTAQYQQGVPPHDDRTLLCLRFKG